ncbi:acyl-CoA dehydrogenase family protein [Bacillus sp. SCS-151]|uniref:acyl-CoA dehydrogenase family protein n=1 Tax=Nanhaiella sioensis TaxID=3115293 RepID=UPI00397ADEB5
MGLDFVKTPFQQEWYNKVGKLADEFAKREKHYDIHGTFPFNNIEQLKEAGYTSLTIPKQFGGQNISLYELVLLQERLAQGDGATALSIGWHIGCVMDITEKSRWGHNMLTYLCDQVKKGKLINRAATERQTGSPTRGGKPQTYAKKKNSNWIINGRKTFTTMAPTLDFFLVSAAVDDQLCEFLIPRDSTGLRIEEAWDTMSMRGTGSHDLVLDQVEVEEKFLVERNTRERKGLANGWLLHIPACYMGIAIAARNYALHFAHTYSPSSISGPISELPNIQRMTGEMELELMQARHFMYSVAERYGTSQHKQLLIPELGAVKHVVTNSAISVVDKAMRILGAQSLFNDRPLERYYRNVRAGLHNPPMDDAVIGTLAQHAFSEITNKESNIQSTKKE